ncbi:antibiotic ABC transporter ATP-binding protein [Sulfodiicoccus acidiphilus]|uniref:Antibiotic ABC transporter ATP-binding protein n=1 Tax=Sulfodiicoccus acidiphilus TaxID=1670455 RepID=A0A348B2D1_9CREN|nr:ABC transporter ATP-binding protein [Sulfodiicoccus acidiphilus]BBD72333.1 antibiotic ABC transporter ATP-binding protein [Sulfodiicoccus acidiphilus]GGT90207.1 antibiotic ABC transporter ATP-binding protein [Sulfodiicoccus acidiphilus]
MLAVELIDLRKSYSDRTALNGVTLSINEGKIFSLLGPNGAGKTTLIRSMLGLIYPDSGKVRLLGRNPFREKGVMKRIGYIQELPNLPPFMTGQELLTLSARLRGCGEEEVRSALDEVGMTDHATRKISRYSKGMVQRLALAEAMLCQPELLVMDEPTIGMDPALNSHMREILVKLRKSGATIFYSSHQLDEVRKLSDEVAIMFRGKIFARGTPEEIVRKFVGIRVRVSAENVSEASQVVSNLNYVASFSFNGDKLIVALKEDKRHELLRALMDGGVRVYDFQMEMELEEAYLRAIQEARESG